MTTATVPSFVLTAITQSVNKGSTYAKVAKLVELRNEEHFANRIGGAWAELVQERTKLRMHDEAENTTFVKDMPIKPEIFLSFCQFLMNQACWAARRYIRAQQENESQEKIRGITGTDFSQDVAEEMCLEPMSTQETSETLDTDFSAMLRLHSVLSSHMSYLNDLEDLHLFADRAQEGEVWKVIATADDFDGALEIMKACLARMSELGDAKMIKDLTTMDFTGEIIPDEEKQITANA